MVGINAYPGQPLQGCVNDVTQIAHYLKSARGFAPADARTLIDAAATAAAIRDGLAWLTAGAAAGDTLYFHYSGHGTLMPVDDAAGKVVATHGAICPVDFDWSLLHALIDTELRDLLDRTPPGVEFLFVSDSCHSGDLTRADAHDRPRVMFAPPPIAAQLQAARAKGIAPSLLETHDRCGLISGCTAEQESADAYIRGHYHGALTYYLLQALKGASAAAPLSALVADVRQRLAKNKYDQEPQVRGPDDILARGFLAGA